MTDHHSALPVELENMIIDHLPAKDCIHFRLVSREFVEVCVKSVFLDGIFTVRPHLEDMARLNAASLIPSSRRVLRRYSSLL